MSARLSWHPKVMSSIAGTIKKRGRPATGRGESVNVRLQPDQLAWLDDWRADKSMTRPEAIRYLLEKGRVAGH